MSEEYEQDPVFFRAYPWCREGVEERMLPAGWYFWDETWSDPQGPFETKGQATRALEEYIATL